MEYEDKVEGGGARPGIPAGGNILGGGGARSTDQLLLSTNRVSFSIDSLQEGGDGILGTDTTVVQPDQSLGLAFGHFRMIKHDFSFRNGI